MRRIFLLLSVFLTLLPSKTAFSQDLNAPACKVCVNSESDNLLKQISRLENLYIQYRWTEQKIRRHYYDRLWKARRQANHPLDKNKREKGDLEVKLLEDELVILEKKTTELSNSIHQLIIDIQSAVANFAQCASDDGVAQCLQSRYHEIDATMESFKVEFDRIFENERDYLDAVAVTAGNRDGLYPQDTLEEEDAHEPYYWRFEESRKSNRFEEDTRILELIISAEEIAELEIRKSPCCTDPEKYLKVPL